ncbi:MAG: lactonase family protein [Acidobacteria bacterium]|jgi:6-phosphogluconolactonase|nr:lactonase family protein [Acidobacteriota bacterium]
MKYKKNDFNRRDFLTTIGGAALLSLANFGDVRAAENKNVKEMLVYIGTYTSGKSKSEGIYIYKLNLLIGELKPYKTIKNVVEPSFLAIDKQHRYLYAVNETEKFEGKNSGAISAFVINQTDGDLQFLNKQPSLGGAPCHVSVSDNGKFVLVANYLGGNVAVFPVEKDGKLGASIDLEQHSGTGANKDRQEAAHAHSINFDKNNRYAVACDLGIDKILVYRFDSKTGKLELNEQLFFQTRAGAGPRHFAFHQNGKSAFVINELDSTITTFFYDGKQGTLKEIQTVPTLPADFSGANTCADIHVSPNRKFLYGSNRGHDSIVSYRIDKKGKLEFIEHTLTGGKTPRNFAIDPTGKFLLAANQNSDSIVVFRIDEKSGKLSATGNTAQVPMPVCLKLISDFSS